VPAISVVMPVHNERRHLDESVASILGQTFRDFELIILENGSTDGSDERLAWWADRDPRIRLHRVEARLGGAGSSNAVTALATAPIIARMDADDVSDPRRLQSQADALARAPDVVLVTTLHRYLDSAGNAVRGRDRWPLLVGRAEMPFAGGCVMFRRSAYERVGGYRESGTWEDLDLCQRLSDVGRVLVVPDALYSVRFHSTSRTSSASGRMAVASALARARERAARTGVAPPPGAEDVAAGALLELAAMRLWAGDDPTPLRSLLVAARREPARRRLAISAWAAWAAVSPASLRAALRMRAWVRDLVASRWIGEGVAREWRFE
jgi:cellulose synthase/poly-beta-1,6-N-acetylglucosamine synthase-like glycosyltransferase